MPKALSARRQVELLKTLHARFHSHPQRHPTVAWSLLEERLLAAPKTLWTVGQMEQTGGEPDVVELASSSSHLWIVDCSAESPAGRRSLCYDREGLESRKEHRPSGSVVEMAAEMGLELLNEEQYRLLQQLGCFDAKTSSWLATPAAIRKRGGALFGDRRYEHVFVYHNGAQSYYAARGFRGFVRV